MLETILNNHERATIHKALQTYGNVRQICVACEELGELSSACLKFPRYDDPAVAREKLHDKVLDEIADVFISLQLLLEIFDMKDEDVHSRIAAKVDRIDRWLTESDSMEQTFADRAVIEHPEVKCKGCKHVGNFNNLKPGGRCILCSMGKEEGWEPKEILPSDKAQERCF